MCSRPASFFTTDEFDRVEPGEEDEPQADNPTNNTPIASSTATGRAATRVPWLE
jgi:hypothetical protein